MFFVIILYNSVYYLEGKNSFYYTVTVIGQYLMLIISVYVKESKRESDKYWEHIFLLDHPVLLS